MRSVPRQRVETFAAEAAVGPAAREVAEGGEGPLDAIAAVGPTVAEARVRKQSSAALIVIVFSTPLIPFGMQTWPPI